MIRVALGLFTVATVGLGAWHLRMTDSVPQQDSTITESPTEIRVTFNQRPRLPVSRLALAGPAGDVMLDSIRPAEGYAFKAAVPTTLEPGPYTVTWRTAGNDGHVMRGSYKFTLSAGGGD